MFVGAPAPSSCSCKSARRAGGSGSRCARSRPEGAQNPRRIGPFDAQGAYCTVIRGDWGRVLGGQSVFVGGARTGACWVPLTLNSTGTTGAKSSVGGAPEDRNASINFCVG